MIYLIITASIANRYGKQDAERREQQYRKAISETLSHLPVEITPLIVENNGHRSTYLDKFTHYGKPIQVVYTDNNRLVYQNKAVNEMLDIREVIQRHGIEETDIIIKLTGRYRILSPLFFQHILQNQINYDVLVKFYNVETLLFDPYNSVLGCYAIRTRFLLMFNPLSMNNKMSPETIFARYARFCGGRLHEVQQLDMECSFADDFRTLVV